MRRDEVIPKQTYKKAINNAILKDTTAADKQTKQTNVKSTEKLHKKKSKTEPSNEKEGEVNGKSTDRKKTKKSKADKATADDLDLMGTPLKSKSKKEKKTSKEKVSTKSVKDASKAGYEEALGISTPSKEIY